MGMFHLQLLGAFRLQAAGGEPVVLPTRKARALLAYLALGGERLRPRSTLASMFWGDAGEPQARESLRQTLSLLRRALLPAHPAPLISEGELLRLEPAALSVDALDFSRLAAQGDPEALAEAAALYGGELLEGLDLSAPEFDRWLAATRQAYRETALDVLSQLLEHALAAGNLDRAATIAARLLALDPLRESSHRSLMQLYVRQGRHAAALQQYQACVDALQRELNVAPEPATTALYREIRAQRNTQRQAQPSEARPVPPQTPPAHPPHRAPELRQITILACELTGPGSLAASADPAELVAAAAAHSSKAQALIESFGGRIASASAQRLTATFGFPEASEHSAEQAVRAGLALIRARWGGAGAPAGSRIRVGIATGAVVAGEAGGLSQPGLTLIGEAPRIAATLQAIAPGDAVLIAARTKELVGELFECIPSAEAVLSGASDFGACWRVLGEAKTATRFTALHRADRTPLFGRDAERASLTASWETLSYGQGQIVFITGEAGIGKSRLALELRKGLAGQPHRELSYQCSPFHRNSVLYPFVREIERAAGIHPGDDAAGKLAKLSALLAGHAMAAEDVTPLFAQLLAIPGEGRFPPLRLSPAQQRRKTLAALLDRMESFARRDPLLLLFEDCHWADASSLEVLDLMAERIRQLPALLVVTARPGFEPAWGALEHVRTLDLARIADDDVRDLVRHLGAGRGLPEGLLDQIVARADGIPLYAEELAQSVLEDRAGAAKAEPHRTAIQPDVPATLQDSLMARLDRLGEAKSTAQIAAVIGREFAEELLRSVCEPARAGRLDEDLALLTGSGLIFETGAPPQRSFTFKHALLRDAAYQSLPKIRRQQVHAAVARVLREGFPAIEQNQPELLARHLSEAGQTQAALGYWLRAGMQAIARSANKEAVAHFEQGLELLPVLDHGGDRQRWERQLLAAMGPAVMATEGYAAARSQRVFERAFELIDEACPAPETLRIICGLWNLRFHRGELIAALPLCEDFLALAKQAGVGTDLGHCLMGQNLCALAEFERARIHLREVLDNYHAGTRSPQIPFGVDEPVLAATYMARVLWALGYPEQAFAAAEEAMEAARNGGNSVSMAVALIARLFLIAHNPQTHRFDEVIGQASAFAAEHGLALFQNWIAFFEAAIRSRRGEAAEALPLMQRAIAAAEHRLSRQFRPFQLGCIAEAHLQLGYLDKALTAVDAAILVGESTGERQSEASLHRLRAEVLHALGRGGDAGSAFETALEVARRQTARMEELRIALSMLRLAGEAERDRARSLLMQAYAKFGEGFEFPDLKAARAELDALGGGLAEQPEG